MGPVGTIASFKPNKIIPPGSNNICIWFTSSFSLEILIIFNYRANILCYSLHKLSYVLGIINLEQSVCV